jgi:riboflavin biosynthesis pyrimidine reductase
VTTLEPLAPAGAPIDARAFVESLGLRGREGERPRLVAAMIASVDGRVAIQGRAGGLGHPADRAVLRELRAGVDAVLVGTGTLRAERYANLLDPDQRTMREAAGLAPTPVLATVTRSGNVPVDIPLFSEPDVEIQIYSAAEVHFASPPGAEVAVERWPLSELIPPAILAHLRSVHGASAVLCEGGPLVLRELVAHDCVDDLILTVAPLLVAGAEPSTLGGPELDPPGRLALHSALRSDDHLFLHYGR